MAVTNKVLIMIESVKLMEQGILKGSGVYGQTPEGKMIEFPEEIHTYQAWKSLGYQVKRGEKAIAQFPIWKYVSGIKKQNISEVREDADIEKNKAYCRMVTSSFFKSSQVEKIKEKE